MRCDFLDHHHHHQIQKKIPFCFQIVKDCPLQAVNKSRVKVGNSMINITKTKKNVEETPDQVCSDLIQRWNCIKSGYQ